MKPFTWKIVLCAVPLLISAVVVGKAFTDYWAGRGGFKLGVDLVGGTILIYEVDKSKLDKKPNGDPDWSYQQAQELARRLKSRLDPSDLFNMSIRVADREGYRFEIIMPTGGTHQIRAEDEVWKALLDKVETADKGKYRIQKYIVPAGQKVRLLAEISAQYPERNVAEIQGFIDENYKDAKTGKPLGQDVKPDEKQWEALLAKASEPGKYPPKNYEVGRGRLLELADQIFEQHRGDKPPPTQAEIDGVVKADESKKSSKRGALTTEDVQDKKELIAQQGSLEFRILASRDVDLDAMSVARANIAKLSKDQKDVLDNLAYNGQPPPIPVKDGPNGSIYFDTSKGRYSYVWKEVGPYYRQDHGLSNPRDAKGTLLVFDPANLDDDTKALLRREEYRSWDLAAAARAKDGFIDNLPRAEGTLIYTREVKNRRMSAKDRREKKYEYFILIRGRKEGETAKWPITGDLLSSARPGMEGNVSFNIKSDKSDLFRSFTGDNKGQAMAIVLDDMVESVATIQSAISTSGQITGKFTAAKIDQLVRILRSGSLPATLKPQPVSENTMGPTLGADTIRKGALSIMIAFGIVLVFMLVYYEFAGLVACVALMGNLLLTLAFMVMIDATFTLPGLAGLVLMLGMAVDANILIYERLREERDRGATLAMALRNGYDRALPTIIDTHLSSIFTAVVLYIVGNDQLKGFGISLTVGLIISLFTSLYMTRVMFDLALGKGWLTKLNMRRLFSKPNIDFMRIRYYWFTATIVLTILGAALFIGRAEKGLNIDFVGGTAYGGELTELLEIDEVRGLLEDGKFPPRLEKEWEKKGLKVPKVTKTDLPDLTVEQIFVSAEGYTDGTMSKLFTVRTSDKDRNAVLKAINKAIGQEGAKLLKTIDLNEYTEIYNEKMFAATLAFVDPTVDPNAKKEPAYASRATVSMFLAQQMQAQVDELASEGKVDRQKTLEDAAKQMTVEGRGQDKDGRFAWMEINLPIEIKGKTEAETQAKIADFKSDVLAVLKLAKQNFGNNPQPERLENFDSQLAAETQLKALYAILMSWAAILLYLWFRFGNWTFGAAAVLCLIHDLFFTLGMIAACHYLHDTGFGRAIGLIDFKIDLPAVAALLTLVGYSVNDTIVVFDRIREVRGKNPDLTAQMINDSVNQTLSRTLLTSLSVWLVVIVLYAIGGEGVHLFAFVMVVGVIVGTYSSIYIASPLLLIFGEGRAPVGGAAPQPQKAAPQTSSTAIRPDDRGIRT